jgi:hypothetical protein
MGVQKGSGIVLKLQAHHCLQTLNRKRRRKHPRHRHPLDGTDTQRSQLKNHFEGLGSQSTYTLIQFIRDIMVLGQEDVIKKVEKLVPQLTKICSH